MYAKGEIDVLWYVSKDESPYVNVDGVVYYVKTGQVVDKPETDSGTVEIDGIKNLKGRNFKKGDSWNFAIKADTDDAPMPEKTTARTFNRKTTRWNISPLAKFVLPVRI